MRRPVEPAAWRRAERVANRALSGEVAAEFESLDEAESAGESALGRPLLEVYSPLREDWSGRIVGAMEFYEAGEALAEELAAARLSAWAGVTAAGLGLGSVLYLIVLGGSRTIEVQRRTLDRRLAELDALSARNRDLRLRVQAAAARASAATEEAMRRIGADLHDGPAQGLAFAALRLDGLADALPETSQPDLEAVRAAVAQSMEEVRALSRGLGLPQIAGRSPSGIVQAAVEAHRLRFGTDLALAVDGAPDEPPGVAAGLCLYRVAQEGLGNAARHGQGLGVEVRLTGGPDLLRLTVADRGPGPGGAAPGLGLSGLRDRVESLGGRFAFGPRPGGGAELLAEIPAGEEP